MRADLSDPVQNDGSHDPLGMPPSVWPVLALGPQGPDNGRKQVKNEKGRSR